MGLCPILYETNYIILVTIQQEYTKLKLHIIFKVSYTALGKLYDLRESSNVTK